MRIPSREEVYDALRCSEATIEGDPEEFVQEVGALCFDALNKIETLKMSVTKGKASATAAEMRTIANSLDFVRLEAGGMPHLEQLQLEALLLKASEAMAATTESIKPRPQQTSTELMRRLALVFSFWVKDEKPYKPDSCHPAFPKPVALPSGQLAWLEAEVDEFIAGLPRAEETSEN